MNFYLLVVINYSFKFNIGTQLLFFSAYPVADRINAARVAARNTNPLGRTDELIALASSSVLASLSLKLTIHLIIKTVNQDLFWSQTNTAQTLAPTDHNIKQNCKRLQY